MMAKTQGLQWNLRTLHCAQKRWIPFLGTAELFIHSGKCLETWERSLISDGSPQRNSTESLAGVTFRHRQDGTRRRDRTRRCQLPIEASAHCTVLFIYEIVFTCLADYTTTTRAIHRSLIATLYIAFNCFAVIILCRSICKAGPELIDATGHDIPSLLESILKLGGHFIFACGAACRRPTTRFSPSPSSSVKLKYLKKWLINWKSVGIQSW